MLNPIYSVADIMQRYHKSNSTARRYMHEMGAKGCPRFVTEEMIIGWERTKRVPVPTRPAVFPGEMKIPRRR